MKTAGGMAQQQQLGERIRARLRLIGYWKKGRPDLAGFCRDKGYRHQYVYAWMKGRVPVQQNLARLATDLGTSRAWLMFGKEEIAEADVAVAGRQEPDATGAPRRQVPHEPSRATTDALPRQTRIIGLMDHQFKRLRDLTERLVEAEARTRALQEAAGSLAGTLDLAEAGDRIVSSVFRLLRVRRSMLYRFDPASGGLVCVAAAGEHGSGGWIGRVLDIGEGVVGRALLERRLIYTSQLLSDPSIVVPEWFVEMAKADGIQSAVGLPLTVGGEVVGGLAVGDGPGREFTEEEIDLLSAFAGHAAIAIQNARLFGEAERRRREAETLAEVGRILSQSLDPEKVGQQIVDSVRALIGAEIVSLQRVEEESGALVKLATSMPAGAAYEWNARLTGGSGAVGLAIRQRAPVTSRDVLADARLTFTAEERACLERTSYRAVLAVPLVVHDRVIGGLSIGDRAGRVFEPERKRLAQAFADQAALALDNALLHKEVRDARDFLRAMATTSTDLVVATDLTGRITHVSSGMEKILGYRAAEMVGTSIARYVREGPAEARALLRRLVSTGQIANYATVFRTKDGKWVEGTATISLLRGTDEAVIGALGVITAPQSSGNGERI